MYFWKLDELKKDLITRPLSEGESFKYLLATVILFNFGVIQMRNNTMLDVYNSIIMAAISVFGVYYTYKCNNGPSGTNFVQKYLSLGFVFGIRWILIVALPLTVIYFAIIGIISPSAVSERTTFLDVVFFNLLSLSYYYMLGKHIKETLRREIR
jgi:hypothetical protein